MQGAFSGHWGSSPWPDSVDMNYCEPSNHPICLWEYLLTKPGLTVCIGCFPFCLLWETVLLMGGGILREEESKV